MAMLLIKCAACDQCWMRRRNHAQLDGQVVVHVGWRMDTCRASRGGITVVGVFAVAPWSVFVCLRPPRPCARARVPLANPIPVYQPSSLGGEEGAIDNKGGAECSQTCICMY